MAKQYSVTVNGTVYDVIVEELGVTAAPAPVAAPKAAPAACRSTCSSGSGRCSRTGCQHLHRLLPAKAKRSKLRLTAPSSA